MRSKASLFFFHPQSGEYDVTVLAQGVVVHRKILSPPNR
jgi:hypothetical protein